MTNKKNNCNAGENKKILQSPMKEASTKRFDNSGT